MICLVTRILSDVVPRCAAAREEDTDSTTLVYCFAHNKSNLYMMHRALKRHGLRKAWVLDNVLPMSGVESGENTQREYERMGDVAVTRIPYPHEMIHTRSEAVAVVEWAHAQGYRHIVAVAPAFHVVRAVMTLVSAVLDLDAPIQVSCISGEPGSWHDICVTHQGRTRAPMYQVMQMESERIERYTLKGDIRPWKQIWAYFVSSGRSTSGDSCEGGKAEEEQVGGNGAGVGAGPVFSQKKNSPGNERDAPRPPPPPPS